MGFRDITGQRSGRLTAVRRVESRKGSTLWLCKCDCGNDKVVYLASFTLRPNLSCGCLHKEIQRKRLTKHSMARSPEYHAWQAMRQRCFTKHHPEYPNYGARGITVCDQWRYSFPAFFADVGLRPSKKHSIERRDNDKGYSPENCYWGTTRDQNKNKRSNHFVEYRGKSLTVTDWALELGINPNTLSERLRKGWSVERAFTPARFRTKPSATARRVPSLPEPRA